MTTSVEARAAVVTSLAYTPGWLIADWIHGSPNAPHLMGVTPRIFRSAARPRREYIGVAFWLLPGDGKHGPRGRRTWLTTLYSQHPDTVDELRVITIHFTLEGFLDIWPPTAISDPLSVHLTGEERSLLVIKAALE